jgi:tRNA(Ile)-lysidine synthase TilS/MesJ
VEFTNVELRSNREREFLKGLEDEGSKIVISMQQFSYVINRKNGKLFASLANENGRTIEELGEVTEKEALEVWREQLRKRDPLGGILNLFKKEEMREPVSNTLKIEYRLIEDIKREKPDKSERKCVVVLGKGFRVELRWDGGCRLHIGDSVE